MSAAVPLVPLLGAVQGHQDRQGPATPGKGELDQDCQDDPLVPAAVGGERVHRTDGVAMAGLAVDLNSAMLVHCIVLAQGHRAFGNPATQEKAGQRPGQTPSGPASPTEHPVITGRVAAGQRAHGPRQVGHGPSSRGQHGGPQQNDEASIGRSGERRCEFPQERLSRLWYAVHRGLLARITWPVWRHSMIPARQSLFFLPRTVHEPALKKGKSRAQHRRKANGQRTTDHGQRFPPTSVAAA